MLRAAFILLALVLFVQTAVSFDCRGKTEGCAPPAICDRRNGQCLCSDDQDYDCRVLMGVHSDCRQVTQGCVPPAMCDQPTGQCMCWDTDTKAMIAC